MKKEVGITIYFTLLIITFSLTPLGSPNSLRWKLLTL